MPLAAPDMSEAICADEEINPPKKLDVVAYVSSPPTVL